MRPLRFSFEGQLDLGDRYADGEVLELDPPALFAFRWVDAVYRFELTPTEIGRRLVFTVMMSGVPTTGDLPSVVRQAPGWDGCLELLAARLDGREPVAMTPGRFLALAERYAEEYGLVDGTVVPAEAGVTGTGAGGMAGMDGMGAGTMIVRFERDLVQPPAAVWAELLDGEPEPEVGAAPPTRLTHGYFAEGEVTDVEPARAVEYGWRHEDAPAGRVRVELRPQEPVGTRLALTQSVPPALADRLPILLAAWHTHLELLYAALYGDVRWPWPTQRTEHLIKVYADPLAERELST